MGVIVLVLVTLALTVMAEVQSQGEPYFCSRCECNVTTVDCARRNRDSMPITDADEWPKGVEVADFYYNRLEHVGRLPPLSRLRVLSFRRNNLMSVSDGAFADLPLLEELDLGLNRLSYFLWKRDSRQNPSERDGYQLLKNLQILKLDGNNFESISIDFFAETPNLRELSLGYNYKLVMSSSTLHALCSLVHLESLDLSYTGLSELPELLLATLTKLTRLDISGNNFNTVPEALQQAQNLKELYLSSNPFAEFNFRPFQKSMTSLHTLVMESMRMPNRVGESSLRTLKMMHHLLPANDTQSTQINMETSTAVSSTTDANLDSHEEEELPLRYLVVLRLDGNDLNTLESDFFSGVPNVRELSLAKSAKGTIDASIVRALSSLNHLEILDLSDNELVDLPQQLLTTLTNLKRLNLCNNDFYAVPTGLAAAQRLKELDLSSNPIKSLDEGAFPPSLASLETLVMRSVDPLSRVGKRSLAVLTGLRSLVLADTGSLSDIDEEAFIDYSSSAPSYPQLQELVISRNSLHALSPKLLQWQNLHLLNMEYNHWYCNCDSAWTIALQPIVALNPEYNYLPCNGGRVGGYHIFSIRVLQYIGGKCWGSSGTSGLTIGLTVSAVLFALVSVLYLTRMAARKCRNT